MIGINFFFSSGPLLSRGSLFTCYSCSLKFCQHRSLQMKDGGMIEVREGRGKLHLINSQKSL